MTPTMRSRTYIPEDDAAVAEFIRQMDRQFEGSNATLSDGKGQVVELPEQLFDVLRQVAEQLASGRGVTVAPTETRLTTQEAADFLGISRPTLVKILESGALQFSTVGRHRRVMLSDLLTYRDESRAERRTILQKMARDGQAAGMLELAYDSDSAPD